MEGEGTPFRRGSFSLQTSLIFPELPRKTRHFMSENSVRFLGWRGLTGKFFVGWGGMDFLQRTALIIKNKGSLCGDSLFRIENGFLPAEIPYK